MITSNFNMHAFMYPSFDTKINLGPSIKDIGIFFWFFDTPRPLPLPLKQVFTCISWQISRIYLPLPPQNYPRRKWMAPNVEEEDEEGYCTSSMGYLTGWRLTWSYGQHIGVKYFQKNTYIKWYTSVFTIHLLFFITVLTEL